MAMPQLFNLANVQIGIESIFTNQTEYLISKMDSKKKQNKTKIK